MNPTHQTYLRYVQAHRDLVLEASEKLGILSRGLKHDLSKYEPDEFKPYAEYFYGTWRVENMPCPPDVQLAFDHAWLLHQKRNDHHWQYWLLREDSGATRVLPMSEPALREMVADWRGASLAITGRDNTLVWYEEHKHIIILHPDTELELSKYLAHPSVKWGSLL